MASMSGDPFTDEMPYWVDEDADAWIVHWRRSPKPTALFNKTDVPAAEQQARTVATNLNDNWWRGHAKRCEECKAPWRNLVNGLCRTCGNMTWEAG